MILQALQQLYQRLLDDPDSGISPPGYSKAPVSFALNLSESGELLDLLDLREQGKKPTPVFMHVPRCVKRSSNVAANFMCDNSGYVLGADGKGKPKRAQEKFSAFRCLQEGVLHGLQDAGALAVLAFLRSWNSSQPTHPVLEPLWDDLTAEGNIVFKLNGSPGYVHERPVVREAWARFNSDESQAEEGQCLVTGQWGPIARLHDDIKGVAGAQQKGAALVSFNLEASKSYGKEQNFNAPVSKAAAFGYVTSLNYLLRSEKHRLRIGDTTTVFWAERSAGLEEDMLAELLAPSMGNQAKDEDETPTLRRDPEATRLVHDVLVRVAEGRPVLEGMTGVNPDVRFCILGLSPNNARLSVRFWHVDSFGALVERIGRHYSDMAIDRPDWESGVFPIWRVIKETAPRKKGEKKGARSTYAGNGIKKAAPQAGKKAFSLLAGALTRSILLGTPYPQGLYTAMLGRIRADQEVNPIRAATVKACLVRRARVYGYTANEEAITMSLNEERKETAYLLGRLFALLEKAQEDATPTLNTTIRDRYFGGASATPRSVFPLLLRLAQHHIAKAQYGGVVDKRIESVLSDVGDFPAHLNLEEQGTFILGYYHQRQALYQKKTVV